ncbi:MAG: hypothetical protein IJT34_05470 [Butyrivibrio sp.]|nr:hypothetical protein [Butyrivibrio sp.]
MAMLAAPEVSNLNSLFVAYDYRDLFLFLGTCLLLQFFVQRTDKTGKGTLIAAGILSVFLSLILVVGYSFLHTDSLELVFGSRVRILASLLKLAGYIPFFTVFFRYLFSAFDRGLEMLRAPEQDTPAGGPVLWRRYVALLEKRPFLTAFLTMWVLYLPMLFICYPALIMGDTGLLLAQGYGKPDLMPYEQIVLGEVKLYNHHPVVHTMFTTLCVRLGHFLTGTWNGGAFCYVLVQVTISFACYAWALRCLIRRYRKQRFSVLYLLYLLLSPALVNYLMVMSKDTIYAALLLLFLTGLSRLLTETGSGRKGLNGELAIAIPGMLAFRKEAAYLLLLTLIILFLLRVVDRRVCAILFVSIAVIHMVWGHVLLPALGVAPGSRKEAFSVPFQMTARYIAQYGEEVTEEERAVIDRILDYDQIVDLYRPTHCIVKRVYRESATSADLAAYGRVFLQMFMKHPNVYFIAAANFKYRYYYPSPIDETAYNLTSSTKEMRKMNKELDFIQTDFHYPEDRVHTALREVQQRLWQFMCRLPLVRLLFSAATYIWAVLALFVYALLKRNRRMLGLMTPLVLMILVIMAGPRGGGHLRYVYPLAVVMPAVFLYIAQMGKGETICQK